MTGQWTRRNRRPLAARWPQPMAGAYPGYPQPAPFAGQRPHQRSDPSGRPRGHAAHRRGAYARAGARSAQPESDQISSCGMWAARCSRAQHRRAARPCGHLCDRHSCDVIPANAAGQTQFGSHRNSRALRFRWNSSVPAISRRYPRRRASRTPGGASRKAPIAECSRA
jgi:hypothetical protein